jgi:NAD(P)H dehydrogenase (quinone)
MIPLFHFGFLVAGLPYSFTAQKEDKEVTGGTPYGPTSVSGETSSLPVREMEKEGARFHGKHIAELAVKFAKE